MSKRLDRYVKGTHLPDYRTAMLMAQEARVAIDTTFILLAQEESKRKKAGPLARYRLLAKSVGKHFQKFDHIKWSGREDSNLRLLRPERSTLPG